MKKNYYFLPKIFTVSLLTLIIFSGGCSSKKRASGPEDEIYVVADSTEYESIEGDLHTVFGKTIYTPQPEQLFNLKRQSVNKIDKIKRKKNIIILAPMNSGSHTSDYLNSILAEDVKRLVDKDSVFVINRNDLWARGQLVMILTANDMEKLREQILLNQNELLQYFQGVSNKRLYTSLYNPRYERKKIEAEFLRDYNWIIYVQADFQLSLNKPENNFIWLRRSPNSDMERWIFVHWIDNASPALLNADSIAQIRNKVTEQFYRTSDEKAWVEISDEYKTTTEVNFNGRYALMTQGLWRFSDQSGGGPFISYTFFDEKSGRIYMIDGSIFAPKYRKKSLIQQVDVILQSFMTKGELSKDKIEDLLEELED